MEKSKFHPIRPVLYTDKLAESIQFYRDILGFEINTYNVDLGWASLGRGEAEIMFSRPVGKEFEQAMFTGSLYIDCTMVEQLWEELKDAVAICYALEEFPWGTKEFAIYDNNGYVIQFGEMLN